MVRRNHNLEVLYTDGKLYWTEMVRDSQVNSPYMIKDIMMNMSTKNVIAYISRPDANVTCGIKIFKYDPSINKYSLEKNPIVGAQTN